MPSGKSIERQVADYILVAEDLDEMVLAFFLAAIVGTGIAERDIPFLPIENEVVPVKVDAVFDLDHRV